MNYYSKFRNGAKDMQTNSSSSTKELENPNK